RCDRGQRDPAQPTRTTDHGHRLPARPRHGGRRDREDDAPAELLGGAGHDGHPRAEGPSPTRARRGPLRLPAHRAGVDGAAERPQAAGEDILEGVAARGDGGARRAAGGQAVQGRAARAVEVDRAVRKGGALMIATIAAASAKATLLLGLALVAAWAWKRRPASARHLLWCLAIVGALAIPPLAAMLPAWRLSVLPRAETTTAPSWEDWLLALWLAGMLVVLGRLLLARIRIHLLGRRAARVTEWRHDRLRELAVARGVDRRVELLESAEVALPMTWGFVR